MHCPISHLSYSAIAQYCSDPQLFYKKYIRHEYGKKTRMGTLIGLGTHWCIDQSYKRSRMDMLSLISEYTTEKQHQFEKEKLILLDKDVQDKETFRKLLWDGIQRCVYAAYQYIAENHLYTDVETEMTYKSIIRYGLTGDASILPLKAKIDLIDAYGTPYDWKVVQAFSTGELPRYTIQAMAYALVLAAYTGKVPKRVVFVEILRTETDKEKRYAYENKLFLWETKKRSGEKSRKPTAPKYKDQDVRIHEVIVEVTQWRITIFMELLRRVERIMIGGNIIQEGLFVPSLESKYGEPEGWQDFCVEVLGYNPYTGEVPDAATERDITT